MSAETVAAVVVAAGRGVRVGGDVPKQYRQLAGRALLARTLESIGRAASLDRAVVVIHPDDAARYGEAIADVPQGAAAKFSRPAHGAALRQGSVLAGLDALARDGTPPDIVLIHDAARPFLSPDLIDRAIVAAKAHGAAVPGTLVTDTIQELDAQGHVVGTPDRTRLRAVQTPQAFRFDLIHAAHRRADADGHRFFTDDGAVASWAGHAVHVFDGDTANTKLTTNEDFLRAEARLGQLATQVRVAQGFDVHAFVEGDHVWLGGVKIPHTQRLSGHSDADVVLHALTDALLGVIGDGDIGVHFPPSDPQWRNAESTIFLRDAVERVRRRGGVISHLDVSVVCEAPKIGPHREAMCARIAAIAEVARDQVGLKATTSEGLGFTGRREGICAFATATVRLPPATVRLPPADG